MMIKIKSKKGFTIVELMVTMLIISIVVAIGFSAFSTISSEVKTETKSVEAIMDTLVGLEVLRLDLEHAGIGLASDEPCGFPVRFLTSTPDTCGNPDDTGTAANPSLVIRSTMNIANQLTYGWCQIDCNVTGPDVTKGDSFLNSQDIVWLYKDKRFHTLRDYSFRATAPCNATDIFLGYPVDTVIANQCETQFCNRITYVLSRYYNEDSLYTNRLRSCYGKTKNLWRRVGGGADNLLNCVANWAVRFDVDSNADGFIDTASETYLKNVPANILDVTTQLKAIHVYLLLQDSQFDPDYSSDYNATGAAAVGGRLYYNEPNGDDVIFTKVNGDATFADAEFVSDMDNFNNYRWKIIKISAKPMNLN